MWKILSIFLLLQLSCASQADLSSRYTVRDWQELYHLKLSFRPDKCLYSHSKDTIYILHKEAAQIEIYKKGKKVNIIGGRGVESHAFTGLSDIALAADGTLFALDSFQKNIKRFDENGSFISQFQLIDIAYPALFDVTSDEVFYIYDEDRNEVAVLRSGTKLEYFGKFALQKPILLSAHRNHIAIYDEAADKTLFFSTFGELREELPGFFMKDKGNFFQLKRFFIETAQVTFAISPSPYHAFLVKSEAVTILAENSVSVGRFLYETKL